MKDFKELIDNKLIINYHNSLLPKHPGRFAEAWSIFEEDKKSGITWHLVVPEVDKGKIILQKDIEFPPMDSPRLLYCPYKQNWHIKALKIS